MPRKLSKQQIKQINDFLEKGQGLPEEYKNLLFETKKEYELVYDGKEREEDIIAETMSVPLQPVKTFGSGGENGWTNKLIFGDNLQVLKSFRDKDLKHGGKSDTYYRKLVLAIRNEIKKLNKDKSSLKEEDFEILKLDD